MLKVQILSNNYTQKPGLMAEHGLSLLVQVDDYRILFDTGQSDTYAYNATTMGLDLTSVDALVLSHGHYDHTGGVEDFVRLNKKAKLFIHPEAFVQRFNKGKKVQIGIPWPAAAFPERIVPVTGPLALAPGIFLTGQVPRVSEEKKTPFLKLVEDRLVDDYVLDEQLMLIRSKRGIYVFLGCCHMGIENALSAVRKLFPQEKIAAVLGGLHLKGSGQEASRQLKDYGVELVVPLHCTGPEALSDLKEVFGERCLLLGAGVELGFELQ